MAKIKPDAYRLRMVLGAWFILLFKDGVKVDLKGPYLFKEAQERCKKLNIKNLDE